MTSSAFHSDPKHRFTIRVHDYAKFRPDYPRAVVDVLRDEADWSPGAVVADIGAGTGILSRLFIDAGNAVFAVEPNDAMRSAVEPCERLCCVKGSAENTTLDAGSIDFIVAGQAFHWFDVDAARFEFQRILKPSGCVALIWNWRDPDGSDFQNDYETLLKSFSRDYEKVRTRATVEAQLPGFFGPRGFVERALVHGQSLDYDALLGRLSSSSFTVTEDDPEHPRMVEQLRTIFDRHAVEGRVTMRYDTRMYFGTLST